MARYKRILAVLVLLSVLTFAVRAAGTPTLRTENTSAAPGGEARVTIKMENNPGIICLSMSVGYDQAYLTLKDVSDGGILGSANAAPDKSKQPYQLSWENDLATKNYTQNGVLATLTFAVAADAPTGELPITLTFVRHSALTADLAEKTFETVNGTITVSGDGQAVVAPPTNGTDATDTVDSTDTTDATDELTPDGSALPTAQDLFTSAIEEVEAPEGNFVPWIVLIACCVAAAGVVLAVLLVSKKKQKHD